MADRGPDPRKWLYLSVAAAKSGSKEKTPWDELPPSKQVDNGPLSKTGAKKLIGLIGFDEYTKFVNEWLSSVPVNIKNKQTKSLIITSSPDDDKGKGKGKRKAEDEPEDVKGKGKEKRKAEDEPEDEVIVIDDDIPIVIDDDDIPIVIDDDDEAGDMTKITQRAVERIQQQIVSQSQDSAFSPLTQPITPSTTVSTTETTAQRVGLVTPPSIPGLQTPSTGASLTGVLEFLAGDSPAPSTISSLGSSFSGMSALFSDTSARRRLDYDLGAYTAARTGSSLSRREEGGSGNRSGRLGSFANQDEVIYIDQATGRRVFRTEDKQDEWIEAKYTPEQERTDKQQRLVEKYDNIDIIPSLPSVWATTAADDLNLYPRQSRAGAPYYEDKPPRTLHPNIRGKR
jgi:hypothetical protein